MRKKVTLTTTRLDREKIPGVTSALESDVIRNPHGALPVMEQVLVVEPLCAILGTGAVAVVLLIELKPFIIDTSGLNQF